VPSLLPHAGAWAASKEVRMEAVVGLSNLAENPATHEAAFAGEEGADAFALFVNLLKVR
jgi:hypothetical protein